jgi:hypothetical protein
MCAQRAESQPTPQSICASSWTSACHGFNKIFNIAYGHMLVQVDLQLDCDALCECIQPSISEFSVTRGCPGESSTKGASTQYCRCTACQALLAADADPAWADIVAQAAVAQTRNLRAAQALDDRMGQVSRYLLEQTQESLSQGAEEDSWDHKRRLAQSPAHIAALQNSVSQLTTVQSTLTTHVCIPFFAELVPAAWSALLIIPGMLIHRCTYRQG